MACCPKTYWCTPDGPVGVEADGYGVFTPPDGATGGPYATLEEVGAVCPYTICTPALEIPSGGLTMSIVDQSYSGPVSPTPPNPFSTNDFPLTDYTITPIQAVVRSHTPVTFNGSTDCLNLGVGFSCADDDSCGGIMVTVSWVVAGCGNGVPQGNSSTSNGWTAEGGTSVSGFAFFKCFATAADIVFPLDLGTFTYDVFVPSIPPVSVGPFTARIIISD